MKNNYLIIGLGSMGKRRIRNLIFLGVDARCIWGYDIRQDRLQEAKDKYGINVVDSLKPVDFSSIKALIVSLPPDRHYQGVEVAYKYNIPVFVEASVVLDDALIIREKKPENLLVAPSCTFVFHPIIKQIMRIIKSQKYGRVCNFSHCYGQYLPDWHCWENVSDYYVSRRIAGAARESLTYELTWLTKMFGIPSGFKGYFMKTTDIGCNIEDTYVGTLLYESFLGNISVDVVARTATRNLIVNFENGQIQWRVKDKRFEIYDAETQIWDYIDEEPRIEEEGYSSNVGENMYIEELRTFLDCVDNKENFPNTMDEDIKVLTLLKKLEDSDGGFYRDLLGGGSR